MNNEVNAHLLVIIIVEHDERSAGNGIGDEAQRWMRLLCSWKRGQLVSNRRKDECSLLVGNTLAKLPFTKFEKLDQLIEESLRDSDTPRVFAWRPRRWINAR